MHRPPPSFNKTKIYIQLSFFESEYFMNFPQNDKDIEVNVCQNIKTWHHFIFIFINVVITVNEKFVVN